MAALQPALASHVRGGRQHAGRERGAAAKGGGQREQAGVPDHDLEKSTGCAHAAGMRHRSLWNGVAAIDECPVYSFVWAMAVGNQSFDDMDAAPVTALR